MMLITQAKEAESLRNKEMKKYAEDRERYLKQQNEVVGDNYTLPLMYFTCFGLSHLSLEFLSVSTWLPVFVLVLFLGQFVYFVR